MLKIFFLFLARHAPDEKNCPLNTFIVHQPMANRLNLKLTAISRTKYKQRLSTSIKPNSFLKPQYCRTKPSKKNVCAFTHFSADGDDEAEKDDQSDNFLQHTTSTAIEKEDEKLMEKPMKCIQRLCNPFETYCKLQQ